MIEKKNEAGKDQLNRVLSFFSRVDAKASWLFATNAAILGIACTNVNFGDLTKWYIGIPAAITVLLIILSMFFIYRCTFPNLAGGNGSLYYFREIAGRTEANFIAEFTGADEEQILRDVLGQVWRNSEILKIKFDAIKYAFILTAASLVPWCWSLLATAVTHVRVPAIH